MIGTAAGFILGLLLAIAIGTLFHLITGGSAGRLLLYIFVSAVGFIIGHFIGQGLRIETWKMGALYLMPATVGSIVALLASRWMWPLRQ